MCLGFAATFTFVFEHVYAPLPKLCSLPFHLLSYKLDISFLNFPLASEHQDRVFYLSGAWLLPVCSGCMGMHVRSMADAGAKIHRRLRLKGKVPLLALATPWLVMLFSLGCCWVCLACTIMCALVPYSGDTRVRTCVFVCMLYWSDQFKVSSHTSRRFIQAPSIEGYLLSSPRQLTGAISVF